MTPLDEFKQTLADPDIRDRIRDGLIGEDVQIEGPYGRVPLLYADYVASGRALVQVEDFIRSRVLPYYANTHTQASFCGDFMTRLREAARTEITRPHRGGVRYERCLHRVRVHGGDQSDRRIAGSGRAGA